MEKPARKAGDRERDCFLLRSLPGSGWERGKAEKDKQTDMVAYLGLFPAILSQTV